MSNPTSSNLHINAPLTNIAVGAVQSTDSFIARRVFPVVPVNHKTDIFRTFNIGDFYRDEMGPRAPGTESFGTGYTVGEDSYICRRYDLHEDIDDESRANADSVFNLDATATKSLTNKALIRQDGMFVQSYMTTGKWATEYTGTAAGTAANEFVQWSDDTSDPVQDVMDAKLRMLLLSGKEPNKMTMSYDVFTKLKTNPSIIDRIKYSGGISNDTPVRVTERALAQVFEMDEVIISKAIKNTAEEGKPMVGAFIVSNVVLLTYSPAAASLFDMSAGYIFSWNKFLGASDGIRIKKFRMEHLESDRVEIQTAYDTKLVSNACGALLLSVLATA